MAQNTVADWSAESDFASINGVDVEVTSMLTKQGGTLLWEQLNQGTSTTYTFDIASSNGSWSYGDGTGNLDYQMLLDGSGAQMNVAGTDNGIFVNLTISATNGYPENIFIFQVISFNEL